MNIFKVPTKEAQDLKIALEKLGARVLVEVFDEHKRIDLTIPAAKINIEVDGIHHLTDANQIVADLNRSYYSNKLGYNTIHIPNKLIHTDLEEIASALAKAARIREEQLNQKRQ